MRKIIPLILCCFFLIGAERWVDPAPGSKGLTTSFDPNDLQKGQARELKNFRVSSKWGALQFRRGISNYWDQGDEAGMDGRLLGVHGFYDATDNYKVLVGIESHVVSSDSTNAHFCMSDTGNFYLFDPGDTLSWISNFDYAKYPAFTENWDFEKVNDLLVMCDGVNPPWAMFPTRASYDTTTDSVTEIFFGEVNETFDPHIRTLAPEAPGQLRVTIWNKSGNLDGIFRYKIAYTEDGDGDQVYGEDPADSAGRSGVPSRAVYPNSQQVALSLFEGMPSAHGEDSTTRALVLRQEAGKAWYIIDTVAYAHTDTTPYIDNIAVGSEIGKFIDDTLGIFLTGNLNRISPAIPKPGTFVMDIGIDGNRGVLTNPGTTILDSTKSYWIAFSYYDPIVDIESRLGPIQKMDADSGWTDKPVAVTHARLYSKSFSKMYERPDWIRTYRSLGDDSTTMVALYQLRANMLHKDSVRFYRAWMPLWGTDDEWLGGTITATSTNYNYGVGKVGIVQ